MSNFYIDQQLSNLQYVQGVSSFWTWHDFGNLLYGKVGGQVSRNQATMIPIWQKVDSLLMVGSDSMVGCNEFTLVFMDHVVLARREDGITILVTARPDVNISALRLVLTLFYRKLALARKSKESILGSSIDPVVPAMPEFSIEGITPNSYSNSPILNPSYPSPSYLPPQPSPSIQPLKTPKKNDIWG